jgi:hypothetical protein
MKRHHSAFALIELLALTGIFALLAGLLVHTIRKVEAAANQTTCTNNLKMVLESWKKGERPTALQESSAGVMVRDMDWETCWRLLDYRIDGCRREGASLCFSVKLRLCDQQQRTVAKWATYQVDAGPGISVARSKLP